MSETQYQPLHDLASGGLAELGIMANYTWRTDPKRLGFTLARYKFVAKMLAGCKRVLEVGCGDAWASAVVARGVDTLVCVDFDERFVSYAKSRQLENVVVRKHDMTARPTFPPDRLLQEFDAAFALDVLEHVPADREGFFLGNMALSVGVHGTVIFGCPSLESQPYASAVSRAGHINCKTEQGLRDTLSHYWRNVYLFGMNDETLHTGFGPMAHYRLAICTGAKL